MDDLNDNEIPLDGAGAAGGGNNDDNIDPVGDQDEARVALDPGARRFFAQMQWDFDQQMVDRQQAADDRLHQELAQQANHYQAQIADLQQQMQDQVRQQQQVQQQQQQQQQQQAQQ